MSEVCGLVVAYNGQGHEHVCGLPDGHQNSAHACDTDGCTYVWIAPPLPQVAL